MVRSAASTPVADVETKPVTTDQARAERPTKVTRLGVNAALLKAGSYQSSEGEIARLLDDLHAIEENIRLEIDGDTLDVLEARRDYKLKQIAFARGGAWF